MQKLPQSGDHQSSLKVYQSFILWGLFFLICFGLGYPTLNRYDPRLVVGTGDSAQYFALVESRPQEVVGHFRHRVLIPYLAQPLARLSQGKIGTWNATSFGLLVINSIFCASAALMIIILGIKTINSYQVGLIGGFLYLSNFAVPNFQLSGLVDAGEGCLLLGVILTLLSKRWQLLPFLGVLGALAKETFVPLSASLAFIYWLTNKEERSPKLAQLIWVVGLGIAGISTVIILQSYVAGHLVWPWDIIITEQGKKTLLTSLLDNLKDHNFWYPFLWLLPLGIVKLNYLPKALLFACFGAGAIALLLGGWHSSGGNVSRAVFNVLGPILSLSAAYLLYSFKESSL